MTLFHLDRVLALLQAVDDQLLGGPPYTSESGAVSE